MPWPLNAPTKVCCRQFKLCFNINRSSHQNPLLLLLQYFCFGWLQHHLLIFPSQKLQKPSSVPRIYGRRLKILLICPFHPHHYGLSARVNFVTKSLSFNPQPSLIHSSHCFQGDLSKIQISCIILCFLFYFFFIFHSSVKALWWFLPHL